MAPFDVTRFTLLWGPGILVLVVFTYGFSRLALHWIDRSMDVKRRQMESSFDIARTYLEQFVSAQKSQADAFSRLATAVERRDSEDSFEHQEMLIAIKAMHRELSAVRCQWSVVRCRGCPTDGRVVRGQLSLVRFQFSVVSWPAVGSRRVLTDN